ncbi:hypothetical protein BD289DRAFT_441883 [Coniella lustricola]|uniref:Kinase-like domain-containing protein n=1 Tax=Coniella lustricola TaxID=2025994 RepID=A0A2T2ZYW4_9PEZI|nr:hypothetical protein BD289DRAFT_441883 [Coniella lustricola]
MNSQAETERVAQDLLAQHNLQLVSCRNLQSLWAGYGHICHILAKSTRPATGSDSNSDNDSDETQVTPLILKYIAPPGASPNARPDEGHIRKLLSYQVELAFYTHLAPQLPSDVAVAKCLASLHSGHRSAKNQAQPDPQAHEAAEFKTAMLLEDLRVAFPVAGEKRAVLSESQVYGALAWLAGFHGHWWRSVEETLDRSKLVRPPLEHLAQHDDAFFPAAAGEDKQAARVWLNGGYTYLDTRRTEYDNLCEESSAWTEILCQPVQGGDSNKSLAELVALALAPTDGSSGSGAAGDGIGRYQTLIHGDVKSENLFTDQTGAQVAFFDFQYVGLGLGVCDLAKLFTCSVPRAMLRTKDGEQTLLRFYLDRLQKVAGKQYGWQVFVRHWETALVDWLRFQASWGFWGNTAWLEGRVRSITADREWIAWLLAETSRCGR